MKIFIVPGYHLPKDISKDEVYKIYFNYVCQEIKKTCLNGEKITVLLSGGNIDMDQPFDRILSKEMKESFLATSNSYNLNCTLFTEEKSLSSIENLIYSKEIIDEIEGDKLIYIFSDLQRAKRTQLTADIIFKNYKLLTIDLSSKEERNNQEIVEKKENLALNFSLWALKNKDNLEEFKQVYVDKFKLLRSVSADKRKETEINWWKEMILKYQDKLNS
jgi:hypothetical protein